MRLLYKGETPTKPASRTHTYSFIGWAPEPAKLTESVTYTAIFQAAPILYTVTFDSRGGSDIPAQTVEAGKPAEKPAVPTRQGYRFGAWYLDEGLTRLWNFSDPVMQNMTLFARWGTDSQGTVHSEVQNASGTRVLWTNQSDSLIRALLTEDERNLLDHLGDDADIMLVVEKINEDSAADALAQSLGEKIGLYLDISLWKMIGASMAPVAIHDTDGNSITFLIEVPEYLRKAPSGYKRTFTLIRVHNGTAEVLGTTESYRFQVSSTVFSVYAVSYRDEMISPTPTDPPKPEPTVPPGPKTGDESSPGLWTALMLLSAAILLPCAVLLLPKRGIRGRKKC